MYSFGKKSLEKIETIHDDLKLVLYEAIKIIDFSVIEGQRCKEIQDKYFNEGRSKVKFPNGKHNTIPSDAVDIAPFPYPANKEELSQAYFLAGVITGVAFKMGIKIRIGCDWNGDGNIRNDKFQDVWHVERI